MHRCVVYWLFDSRCTDPFLHGYVGITKALARRVTEHRRRFSDFEVVVLFTGTWVECIAEESRLRPEPAIGWNLLSGGTGGRSYPPSIRDKISNGNKGKKRSEAYKENIRAKHLGRKHSAQRCAENALRQLGHPVSALSIQKTVERNKRPRSPQYLANMKAGQKRRTYTDQQRAVLSAASKGKKRSAEHRAAISEANKRRVISDETRAKMRIAAKARMTPEVRAKLSAAKRKMYQEPIGESD